MLRWTAPWLSGAYRNPGGRRMTPASGLPVPSIQTLGAKICLMASEHLPKPKNQNRAIRGFIIRRPESIGAPEDALMIGVIADRPLVGLELEPYRLISVF